MVDLESLLNMQRFAGVIQLRSRKASGAYTKAKASETAYEASNTAL